MFWALVACSPPPNPRASAEEPRALVVVLDGVRVEEFSSHRISGLSGISGEELAASAWAAFDSAMVVREAVNDGLASTAPAHASIVTGRHEPVMTAPIANGDPGVYYPETPTIFEELRGQLGLEASETLLTANSVVMPGSTRSISPAFGQGADWDVVLDANGDLAEADEAVLARMKEVVEDGPPKLWLVNLHDGDRLGHTGNAAEYLERVERQSAILANFLDWAATQHAEYADSLLTVVTTDHGRHRHDLDDGWAQHGDSCLGCREVPLIVLGGAAESGEYEGDYSLLDIAPTLAGHLGITMPYAEGLPLFGGSAREGEVRVAASGDHVATQRWLPEIGARSEVIVDGSVVSTAGVFAAEAPSLGGNIACFRELSVDRAEPFATWALRCVVDSEDGWLDAGVLDGAVGPFARAALAEQNGVVWAAWLHTPQTRGADLDNDSVHVAWFDADNGWIEVYSRQIEYTATEVSIAVTSAGFVVAAATSLPEPDQAYTRRIFVAAVSPESSVETTFTGQDLLSGEVRAERPVLRATGDSVDLGFVVVGEASRGVAWAQSADGGQTWGAAAFTPSNVFPSVSPVFSEGGLSSAQLGEEAEACTQAAPAAVPVCAAVDSPRIDSLAAGNSGLWASTDAGSGTWVVTPVGP